MNRKIELAFSLFMFLSCLSMFETKEYDEKYPDSAENAAKSFIDKVDQAQILRKEVNNQLNALLHVNLGLNSRLAPLKKSFNELDVLLDEFIPSESDTNEIRNNLKSLNQYFLNENLNVHKKSYNDASKSDFKLSQRFDWYKRNMLIPSGYHKIPVIRTGK